MNGWAKKGSKDQSASQWQKTYVMVYFPLQPLGDHSLRNYYVLELSTLDFDGWQDRDVDYGVDRMGITCKWLRPPVSGAHEVFTTPFDLTLNHWIPPRYQLEQTSSLS
jgi:hypothetical protein